MVGDRELKCALAALVAAMALTPVSASTASPAAAIVNGKRCVPVPGGRARMGIQLYSLPGLLNAGAANVDEANQAQLITHSRGSGPSDVPDGTAANIPLTDSTFARLKSLGFSVVERAGYYALSAPQLRAALVKARLTGLGLDDISAARLDASIQYIKQSGQRRYIGAVGWGYGGVATPEQVKLAADGLNAAGKKTLANGLHLYVHNHRSEFTPILYDINHDGKAVVVPAIEALMDQTDPRYLGFEIDVHWIIAAYMGEPYNEPPLAAQQSALAFVRKHASRVVIYHVKETSPDIAGGEGKLGQGITDWPAWWAAAPRVAYYLYEMDGPPDPLQYAKIAADYLQCKPTG